MQGMCMDNDLAFKNPLNFLVIGRIPLINNLVQFQSDQVNIAIYF